MTKTLSLSIGGMHCSSCSTLIERALKKVAGVTRANVNFAAEKAIVIFDEQTSSIDDLIRAVAKAGYQAAVVEDKDTEFEARKRALELRQLQGKFWFSFL